MFVRKAESEDLDEVMKIYTIAQDNMIQSGNPTQWGHFYPSLELIENDISQGVCHLVCEDEEICGVFALFDGNEHTYQYIENGQWINDDAYVTIHRIASDGKHHGIFNCAVEYCKSISQNIRIDTHKNNLVMQRQIEKNGFQRCGIIYVNDGSDRIAYQWCID